MKRHLRISPAANADLQAIWAYGAQNWSVEQAETYARGLGQVFALLCDQPMLARLRFDLNPPLRLYRYQSHIIIYGADDACVTILRIVHGRAHWAEYLAQ